jgi:hypothetical protein
MSTKGASILEADARIRTADPFITSEVLYQLSYVGGASKCSRASGYLIDTVRALRPREPGSRLGGRSPTSPGS